MWVIISEVERIVKANDREYNEKFQYADNRIHTSKYNILTFLPINLFEQFQRVANAYFLFLLILQFRHKSDNQVNNRLSEVLIDSKLQNEKWMNVKVGDIVKLENNQFVAADLLLLSSSEPHGLCYIETAELDGETNLKVRHALSVTSELGADFSRLAKFDGIVVCEAPNNKLDKFTGVLSWKDSKHCLNNENIILRGCILRNTNWCFGMVIFAGEVHDDVGQKTDITKKNEPVDFSVNPQADTTFQFSDHHLMESVKLGDSKVHEFLRLLALCHTVMSEENSAGQLIYQVQSPDEGALVTAARNFGFIFKSRTPETITVEELGTLVTYQLLAFLDFNNIRKRMSVIVRNPEGQIKLYSKGADTILFEKLHPSNEDLLTLTTNHLSEFAGEGLRTLAIAYRDLDDKYFKEWHKMLEDASTLMDERDERIAGLYEEIERDLMLLGATAVEDKLQEGVIETIASLSLANIKIWVLTGDKQETAINIGYACNMLTDDMNDVFIIAGNTAVEVREELRKAKENLFGQNRSSSNGHVVFEKQQLELDSVVEETITGDYALIINGHSLAHALESDVKNDLLELACMCKTVVCCRVTPLQKAQVVELVKNYRNAVTLAIGDGANDVSMIKMDSWYESIVWYMPLSYMNTTVYDQWFITLFNIVYTSLPVLAMGIFDQDVSDQNSMDYPQLYEPGQLNLLFNKRKFFICMAHGIYTSLALFFIPYGAFYNVAGEDGQHIADYQSFAVTMATSLVIVVSVQIALDTSYWTVINHVFIWGSVATYFSILFTMHSNGIFGIFPNQFPFVGNAQHSLTQKCIWLVILLTTVASVVPVVVVRFLKMDLCPTLSDQIRQRQKAQKKTRPLRSRRPQTRRSSSRRSGYAFAHQEGYGELITSGKNMRAKNPPLTSGLEKTLYNSTSWIENFYKKTTDTVSSFSQDKTVKL
ncbi:hypothetical protein GH733_004331 [Mirounga leonina]|nr:hypothetical protein GH733_004331 [Mirounga leonina]